MPCCYKQHLYLFYPPENPRIDEPESNFGAFSQLCTWYTTSARSSASTDELVMASAPKTPWHVTENPQKQDENIRTEREIKKNEVKSDDT